MKRRKNPVSDAAYIKRLEEELDAADDEIMKYKMLFDMLEKRSVALWNTVNKVYKTIGLARDDLDWTDEKLFERLKAMVKMCKKNVSKEN